MPSKTWHDNQFDRNEHFSRSEFSSAGIIKDRRLDQFSRSNQFGSDFNNSN